MVVVRYFVNLVPGSDECTFLYIYKTHLYSALYIKRRC